jgi:reelin
MRLAVSKDIDSSMLEAIEFYFKYGCNGNKGFWPRSESVLLQYSINGGITWNLLKEINYRNQSNPK